MLRLISDSIIIQKGDTVVIVDKAVYLKRMEELLSDTSKFNEITFNTKHKVNKELRHLLDITITTYQQRIINLCVLQVVDQGLCMGYVKYIKKKALIEKHNLFDPFCLQIAPARTIWRSSLYLS